jgi:hypothetical protein
VEKPEEIFEFPSKGAAIAATMDQMETMRSQLVDLMARAKAGNQTAAVEEIRKQLERADQFFKTVSGMISGTLDAAAVLTEQPTAKQLAFPGRRVLLLKKAEARLSKSRHAFMSPRLLLGALGVLFPIGDGGEGLPVAFELEHRILHFLAEGNLVRFGAPASALLSRIVKAGRIARGGEDREGTAALLRMELQEFLRRARDGGAN